MIEGFYKLLMGNVNPQKPQQSMKVLTYELRYIGVWEPESKNQFVRSLYTFYSYFFRIMFINLPVLFQLIYIKDIEDIKEIGDALFILMSTLPLTFKLQVLYQNRDRLRAVIKKLNSESYRPKNSAEESEVKTVMIASLRVLTVYSTPSSIALALFSLFPLFAEELVLPVPAWYPFDTKPVVIFGIIYVYQMYGVIMCTLVGISTDSLLVSLLLHCKSQVKRLGIILSNVGHELKNVEDVEEYKVDQSSNSVVNSQNVGDVIDSKTARQQLIECVKFYEELEKYINEVVSIFKAPIYFQLLCTTLAVCSNMFFIANESQLLHVFMSLIHMNSMIIQIFSITWAGNELLYASKFLGERCFFSNFVAFDRNTKKDFGLFQQRLQKEIKVHVGVWAFSFALRAETFIAIIKTSYSIFTLMRSVQLEQEF